MFINLLYGLLIVKSDVTKISSVMLSTSQAYLMIHLLIETYKCYTRFELPESHLKGGKGGDEGS